MTEQTPHTPDDDTEVVEGEVVVETIHDTNGPEARFSEREWPRPWMGVFLDAIALMPVVTAAARTAGIARSYAYQAAKEWPVFAEGWREAYEQGVEILEQHAHRWGTVGIQVRETRTTTDAEGKVTTVVVEQTSVSPTMTMFLLKRHRPEYRERTAVEHTLPGVTGVGGSEAGEVDRRPTRERMLELAQIARKLEPDPVVEDAEVEL